MKSRYPKLFSPAIAPPRGLMFHNQTSGQQTGKIASVYAVIQMG